MVYAYFNRLEIISTRVSIFNVRTERYYHSSIEINRQSLLNFNKTFP